MVVQIKHNLTCKDDVSLYFSDLTNYFRPFEKWTFYDGGEVNKTETDKKLFGYDFYPETFLVSQDHCS